MRKPAKLSGYIIAIVLTIAATAPAMTAVIEGIPSQTRCSVCGMFVAQYPTWVVQVHHADGSQQFFDGVKDMMAYFFNPEKYTTDSRGEIKEIWLKDYYSLTWLDARSAFFVTGSDVYGPMGHELIPFSSKAAAESFLKDHHGKNILIFNEITEELVDSMRTGQKMR